jgi:hypothetical protein
MKKQEIIDHLKTKTFLQLIISIIYIMGNINGVVQSKEEEPP